MVCHLLSAKDIFKSNLFRTSREMFAKLGLCYVLQWLNTNETYILQYYYTGSVANLDVHVPWSTEYTQCQILGKIVTCPLYKLLLSFLLISDVYRSFIPNKNTSNKYCLSGFQSSLGVRQNWLNFMGLAGTVIAIICKTNQFFNGLRQCSLS